MDKMDIENSAAEKRETASFLNQRICNHNARDLNRTFLFSIPPTVGNVCSDDCVGVRGMENLLGSMTMTYILWHSGKPDTKHIMALNIFCFFGSVGS